MAEILGLDISTSCIGWTILDGESRLLKMGHISFKPDMTLWEKADFAHAQLALELSSVDVSGRVFIEESLQSFRPGFSSASTLMSLAKFNGLVSYYLRGITNSDPIYIPCSRARKLCGVKLVKKQKHPRALGHKHQTFNQIVEQHLQNVVWPEKKGPHGSDVSHAEKVVDWALDEVDSYVIARAGWLNTRTEQLKICQNVQHTRKNSSDRKSVRKGRSVPKLLGHSGDMSDLRSTEHQVVGKT